MNFEILAWILFISFSLFFTYLFFKDLYSVVYFHVVNKRTIENCIMYFKKGEFYRKLEKVKINTWKDIHSFSFGYSAKELNEINVRFKTYIDNPSFILTPRNDLEEKLLDYLEILESFYSDEDILAENEFIDFWKTNKELKEVNDSLSYQLFKKYNLDFAYGNENHLNKLISLDDIYFDKSFKCLVSNDLSTFNWKKAFLISLEIATNPNYIMDKNISVQYLPNCLQIDEIKNDNEEILYILNALRFFKVDYIFVDMIYYTQLMPFANFNNSGIITKPEITRVGVYCKYYNQVIKEDTFLKEV